MEKVRRLQKAMMEKIGSITSSFIVVMYQFKREYPYATDLMQKIVDVECRLNTPDEPSEEEIDELIVEIKSL